MTQASNHATATVSCDAEYPCLEFVRTGASSAYRGPLTLFAFMFLWPILGMCTAVWTADNANLAPRAEITASVADDAVAKVADGLLSGPGGIDDGPGVWVVRDAKDLPASLVFTWKAPVTVSTVVYYGRSRRWGFQVFKDYALYLDDAEKPVVEGAFRNGYGPQLVALPAPTQVRKLRLEFRSKHGDHPGATEVQIFSKPPVQEDLLSHFTDFSRDFRYAYYPSRSLIRILLPQAPADATDWRLVLRPEGGGAALAERSGKVPMAASGEAMPVPDLPSGNYILTLTLTGGTQPVVEERIVQRNRPEWEGNKLGRDEVVIPPFTPLIVDEKTNRVDCVLRRHTHGAAGLWSQVVSQGRDLLAGPVRLEVTQGGKIHTAASPVPRFTIKKQTVVAGETAWTAGTLTGTTQFAYDYDGLQTITLELAPTETVVERMQLVIPLKDSETWLMHPVTTQLRMHFAGRIPALTQGVDVGKVWDSSKVPNRINGNFVPYIYLGGPERGLCFAADNDRDWITDTDTPMMEIDRSGDTVLLRLNLVATPSQLTRKRTLTFALQATPAKPMPEEPYNWRRWWATRTDQDIQSVQIAFWGGNGYWGGKEFATSVYPAGKDYGFYDKLAEQRRTGKLDKAFAEKWFAQFSGDKKRDEFEPAMRAGFEWSHFTPANGPETTRFNYLIPYTNPRGASGETMEFLSTYIDEWLQGDITDPKWAHLSSFDRPRRVLHGQFPGWASWYQVEPVSSRVDMLVFYYKRMIETFADGVYFDNWFLQPSYVPAEAGGPGYVDDAGRPRAGVNLRGFRDLVRRTATMMHIMGKRPLTYLHMTNVNIVPMLSFGTANLDWEWRDGGDMGSKDLQDRIGLDEILAHNLGLQAGNLPVAITGNIIKGSTAVRDWLNRTAMAVCIPHEIRMHQGTSEVSFAQTQLARFGYGMPDCKVFRYWDAGFPLKTDGAKLRALVLARNGKAMIALGHFGPADAMMSPIRQGAPSLEEYDAAQRGLKTPVQSPQAPTTDTSNAKRLAQLKTYSIRITLDLVALGVAESAQGWDVELKAGRKKSANPGLAKLLDQPTIRPGMPEKRGNDLEKELEKLEFEKTNPALLKRLGPGEFQMEMAYHDFALIVVE